MTKTKYHAIDANGTKHTRSTERTYSHTVVARYSRAEHMARATRPAWTESDGNNWDYNFRIANGNDPYPAKNYLADHPDMYSAEKIAQGQVRADEDNAKRVAQSVGLVSVTREQYIANQLAARIAAVEATDFTVYHNLGWCGRYELAVKLANSKEGVTSYYTDITILEAVAG